MTAKKYQVFVSSTYKDLVNHRNRIAQIILQLGHIPAAMEFFPAVDEEQLTYIKGVIDQCDYYVLILAGKYGSEDTSGISYTEREYDYAVDKKKFVIAFPMQDIQNLSLKEVEQDTSRAEKLNSFRAKVSSSRVVRFWTSESDLITQASTSIASAMMTYPQQGWVRTPQTSNEQLLEEIYQIKKENEDLRNQLSEMGKKPQFTEPVASVDCIVLNHNTDISDNTIDFRVNISNVSSGSLELVSGAGHYTVGGSQRVINLAPTPIKKGRGVNFTFDLAPRVNSTGGVIEFECIVFVKVLATGVVRVHTSKSRINYSVSAIGLAVSSEQLTFTDEKTQS